MAEVNMLFPIEPSEFWRQMKKLIEEVLVQKSSPGAIVGINAASQKNLLKAKEVCEIFKVSKPTLYEWMHQGKLKSFKIASRRFFLSQDIEELIKTSGSGKDEVIGK